MEIYYFGTSFKGLFAVLSTIGNALVALSILYRPSLRRSYFNLTILHLACVLLLDSVFLQGLELYSLSENAVWLDAICPFGTFIFIFVKVQTLLAITAMLVERSLSVYSPSQYSSRMSPCSFGTSMAILFAQSLCFAIIAAVYQSSGFVSIWHQCIVQTYSSDNVAFTITLSVVCYALPSLLCFFALSIILYRAHQYRICKFYGQTLDNVLAAKVDIRHSLFAFHVFLFYLVFEVPSNLFDVVMHLFQSGHSSSSTYSGMYILLNDYRIVLFSVRALFSFVFPIITYCSHIRLRRSAFRGQLCKVCCLSSQKTNIDQ